MECQQYVSLAYSFKIHTTAVVSENRVNVMAFGKMPSVTKCSEFQCSEMVHREPVMFAILMENPDGLYYRATINIFLCSAVSLSFAFHFNH